MKLTISRASDDFRCVPLPDCTIRPCQQAIWDNDAQRWYINLFNVGHLMELMTGDETLTVSGDHVTINDVN